MEEVLEHIKPSIFIAFLDTLPLYASVFPRFGILFNMDAVIVR